MPWTKKNFPGAMKNLASGVRSKAIEIGNAMMQEREFEDEDFVIATAIVRARDWASENGKRVYKTRKFRPGGMKRILT